MTRKPPHPDPSPRRAYQPPRLTRIQLIPDEAVLASCKNAATLGPFGVANKCSGPPAVCSHSGS